MNGIQLTDFELSIKPKKDAEGKITAGLQVGDILYQNQAIILCAHQGELKENPAIGCGISDMLLDNDPIYWRTRIREQLEMDGQTVSSVRLKQTGIEIESTY